ncbi:MAG TPA: chemotaxis protein CheW [Mycobacteriales bacterium]|nr:chemotaxis protein CheW [Mycobacteriales bacterium]
MSDSRVTTTPGYVLFRLGERTFATALDDVREIVRLTGLERLPGTQPPLAGVLVLRGTPLPVLDVRENGRADDGDVLVMDVDGDNAGVAVDAVLAVLHPDELPEGEPPSRTLPSYVIGVRRRQGAPVMLVDLRLLLDTTAAGWAERLEEAVSAQT